MISTRLMVWDLGGVVVDLDFQGMLCEAAQRFDIAETDLLPLIREEFKTPSSGYSLTEKAVAGLITGKSYIAGLKDALGNRINEQDIEGLLQRVLVGENSDTVSLIRRLSENGVRHACMSNIDETHWNKIKTFPSIDGLFEKKFLSFEQKLVKPHANAFDRVLEMLGCDKEGIIFIDDREDNIQSAKNYGIDAIQFVDHVSLRTALAKRGLSRVWQ